MGLSLKNKNGLEIVHKNTMMNPVCASRKILLGKTEAETYFFVLLIGTKIDTNAN